jgi:hypothetical protein
MTLAPPIAAPAKDARSAETRVAGLAIALVALFLFALAVFSLRVFGDGDTFTHLAAGEWILAHGTVPRADPFSFSFAGQPWTAHEWLAEVVMALAFRAGGWSAVAILTGAAAGAAALIVGLRVARDLSGTALFVVVALGLGLITASLLARPHVLALPLVAAWGAALMAARDRGRAPSLALVPLMTLWSNLHGGFLFGLALIGPFALEAVALAPWPARVAAARDWTLFALASLAAALVNPYGVEALLFPFRLMGVDNLSRISEWRPQDFGHLQPMAISLLLLLGFALTRPMRTPPIRAATLVGLVFMSLQHARHEMLLGLIAPMLLARPIAAAIGAEAPTDEDWRRIARLALSTAAALAAALSLVRFAAPLARVDGPTAPIAALNAVPDDLRAKPVLNGYGFGGYLIWSGVRPFIDGRADMYGGEMLGLYEKLYAGDPATVEATLKRYDAAWTIFPPDGGVVAALDREPGWRRLYADARAVVHVRDDAAAAGLRGAQ